MSYTSITGMRSNRYPLMGMGSSGDGLSGCGCSGNGFGGCGCGAPVGYLGADAPEGNGSNGAPTNRWKMATAGLAVLLVAQFLWWDAKAPQVLRK
jgi:hypothetical protein